MHDIREEDELTIAYGERFTELRNERRARLQQVFGFECHCPACDENKLYAEIESERTIMEDKRKEFVQRQKANNMSLVELVALKFAWLKGVAEQGCGTFTSVKAYAAYIQHSNTTADWYTDILK